MLQVLVWSPHITLCFNNDKPSRVTSQAEKDETQVRTEKSGHGLVWCGTIKRAIFHHHHHYHVRPGLEKGTVCRRWWIEYVQSTFFVDVGALLHPRSGATTYHIMRGHDLPRCCPLSPKQRPASTDCQLSLNNIQTSSSCWACVNVSAYCSACPPKKSCLSSASKQAGRQIAGGPASRASFEETWLPRLHPRQPCVAHSGSANNFLLFYLSIYLGIHSSNPHVSWGKDMGPTQFSGFYF